MRETHAGRESKWRKIAESYSIPGGIWVLAALAVVLLKYHCDPERLNNFLIYRQTFYHAAEHLNLYAYYPDEYFDHNLYGPLFSVLIAPFALLPKLAGAIVWELFLCAAMYLTVLKLPFGRERKVLILWYVTNEVISALLMTQFNLIIAALLPATYMSIRKEKEWLAGLLVAIGTLTKIYGIAGLPLMLLSHRKWRCGIWLGIWGAVLIFLPMMIWGWEYAAGQYREWYLCLSDKNELNTAAASVIDLSFHQNVSILGFAHRVSGREFSDVWILLPAAILFVAPLFRYRQYSAGSYGWGITASALMSLILFSTGSESSGYIMALLGVALWYWSADWKRSGFDLFLLLFALVLGSFGHSDLMPKYLRQEFIRPYVLKAFPIMLVWLKQVYELLTRKYLEGGSNKG